MLSQRNFFGFHLSCFFLSSFVSILVFHVDEEFPFLSKELKGRKNVYSIMRLPALAEKAKQKATDEEKVVKRACDLAKTEAELSGE